MNIAEAFGSKPRYGLLKLIVTKFKSWVGPKLNSKVRSFYYF